MITSSDLFCAASDYILFRLGSGDGSWFHDTNHRQVAKGVGASKRIKEEHEADQRTIDSRRSIALGEQVVTIGFGIDGCHLGRFETRIFLVQPAGKVTDILRR